MEGSGGERRGEQGRGGGDSCFLLPASYFTRSDNSEDAGHSGDSDSWLLTRRAAALFAQVVVIVILAGVRLPRAAGGSCLFEQLELAVLSSVPGSVHGSPLQASRAVQASTGVRL